MNATHTPGPWLDCGEGILREPARELLVATRVVEAKNFGRIFEVFDYSNEPEQNFRLILEAPELLSLVEEILTWTKHKETPWAKRATAALARVKGTPT